MTGTTATLKQIPPGIHAWLQPTTGWSRNKAGLITGGGAAMIVETLFDLPNTCASRRR
jgi:cyclase